VRTLYESANYAQCCAKIQPNAVRLDEALRYPLYQISDRPEAFPLIPGTLLRRVRTNDFPGAPALLLFFTIDGEDSCTLQSLEPLPVEPEIRGWA
jgi:hypothetical protein